MYTFEAFFDHKKCLSPVRKNRHENANFCRASALVPAPSVVATGVRFKPPDTFKTFSYNHHKNPIYINVGMLSNHDKLKKPEYVPQIPMCFLNEYYEQYFE